jgi:hypothetical protein
MGALTRRRENSFEKWLQLLAEGGGQDNVGGGAPLEEVVGVGSEGHAELIRNEADLRRGEGRLTEDAGLAWEGG